MAWWRCQRAPAKRSTSRAEDAVLRLSRTLRSSEPFAVREHFTDRSREFGHASAGHDNRVAAAMSFFGDTQKFPAIVFAQLNMEMLALDLNLASLDDVIHFWKSAAILLIRLTNGKLIFTSKIFSDNKFALTLRINSSPRARLLAFLLVCDREIDLAFEGIDPNDNDAQLVADRKAAARLATEQTALRCLERVEIVSER